MATYTDRIASTPPVEEAWTGSSVSGVSWGAIFAGATAAASLSLILILLGAGLGFSALSPWTSGGPDAKTMSWAAIGWITFTQLAASGMGGYMAGRLRVKWAGIHTDEVYFRDTAHGFLAWGVATLITAATLTTAIGAIVGAGANVGASMVGAAAPAATATAGAVGAQATSSSQGGPSAYFVDALFRRDPSSPSAATTSPSTEPADGEATTAEVTRIFMHSINAGALPAEDVRHVGQLVSQRTGLSQADAEKRVNDVYAKAQAAVKDAKAKAKEAADAARKASAYGSLWLFISMLIGAFIASLAATWGGRRRDL